MGSSISGLGRPGEPRPRRVASLDDIPEERLEDYEATTAGDYQLVGLKPLAEMSELDKTRFTARHGLGTFLAVLNESRARR